MTTVNNPPLSVSIADTNSLKVIDSSGKEIGKIQGSLPINVTWSGWFLRLYNRIGGSTGGMAPNTSSFITQTPDPELVNEQALSLLSSGYAKITTGSGVISTTSTIPASDLSSTGNLTKVDDTNITLTLGGTPSGALLKTTSITAGWTGTLEGSRGGSGINNGTNTLSFVANSVIDFGIYTPTLTNTANVSASTAYSCQYSRLGSVVTVSGKVDIDVVAATTLSTVGISLPIASNFANTNECGGTANSNAVASLSAAIYADSVNDRASLEFISTADTANRSFYFLFTYRII